MMRGEVCDGKSWCRKMMRKFNKTRRHSFSTILRVCCSWGERSPEVFYTKLWKEGHLNYCQFSNHKDFKHVE